MNSYQDKNVLIVGLAKTGISIIKYLHEKGANIIVFDKKNKNELANILSELKDIENINYFLGENNDFENVDNISLTIVSPGVPLDLPIFNKIRGNNIQIIGDIEFAYREILKIHTEIPHIISITGTNGKTTTTTLVGELFKNSKCDTHVVGNIGTPIVDRLKNIRSDSVIVSELSSFQLESVNKFRPKISAILNITEDHLNRHHTMNNYINAKSNIFKNQNFEDVVILNYDDFYTRDLSKSVHSNVYFFSTSHDLSKLNKKGVYVDDEGYITINIDFKFKLMHKSEISLPGEHNLQNCLVSVAIGYLSDLELSVIVKTLSNFKGVEHRQELVRVINSVMYVNDSKGTNPDSTIKAIESYDSPIILIAGGKDKKSTFKDMIRKSIDKVKVLVLMGETAEIIEREARLYGFEGLLVRVQSMKDAVVVANKIAKSNDVVLLSPASASWDMYSNFEERGNEFKKYVLELESR